MNLSELVAEQRERLTSRGVAALNTRRERVYHPVNPHVAASLMLDS